MVAKSGTLDVWRTFFRTANSDIFDVIEYAIVVAASDCPKEFRLRRDRIAEKLFSCRLARCFGCNHVELVVPQEEENDEGDEFKDSCGGNGGFGSKDSKVNSSRNDGNQMNRVSNYSYDEAEALTEKIEEESQIVGEVLRIKEMLANHKEESDAVLFESLRRLQLMQLSVGTLQATEIGKAVNCLRKHGSKQIQHLARALIDGWKEIVDEWVSATTAIADGSPDSVNPSVVDEEEGLPSPPLDEGLFFTTQTTSLELSQFFDGMDDDGNPRNNGVFDKNHENRRRPPSENQGPKRSQRPPHKANVATEDMNQIKKHEATNRQNKPSSSDSGPGRPSKMSLEHKAKGDNKSQKRTDLNGVQKKPPAASLQDKSKCSDEISVRVKLEATKRKLQEGYQQAENAKKQRTIQVMELHDLPKQGLAHRNFHPKPGFHNRNRPTGRR